MASADEPAFFDDIELYCDQLSYEPGDQVTLHVSTRAERYRLGIERWGAEREIVADLGERAGSFHEPPPDASAMGCRWPTSVTWSVPDDARSGFYLVTATAEGAAAGRDVAHGGLVVRAGTPRRKALLVLATNTWNAYNTWGGTSLYTGGHQVSFRRPWPRGLLVRDAVDRDDRKSRPVRFGEEADVDGDVFQRYRHEHGYSPAIGSAGWFTHERRFVEWAERRGYEFDMSVSSDLEHAGALDGYDVVLGVGHDEYWSAPARDAIDAHIAGGGHYVSLSGNTMFWQVRLVDDAGGHGIDHMVCHKYRAHLDDPLVGTEREAETSGVWCDPLVGRPEWTTLGAGSVFGLYHRFGKAAPRGVGGFTVFRPDHWLFAGTDLGYGDVLGADHGVVGYETVGCPIALDEFQLPVVREVAGMPGDHKIVGLCLSTNLSMGEYPKSISAENDQGDLEFLAERFYGDTTPESLAKGRHGNAVMVTCRPFGDTGGEVVTLGTTDWVFGLDRDSRVDKVTQNICDRYL